MASFPHLIFGAASSVFSFGAHRVLLEWGERSFAQVAARKRPLLVACAVIAPVPWLARAVALATHARLADLILTGSLLEFLLVLAGAGPLLLLMLLSRALRGAPRESAAGAASVLSTDPAVPAVTRRGALETIGGAAILGTTGAAFGWGMTVGRHDYEICEVPVRIAGLPKALDGYAIAQISDIHAGLFVGARELADAADLMRKVRPDLVVATGDLVDFDPSHGPELARALAGLAPRDGVFAILGNHDYYAGAEAVSAAIRGGGVTLLVNEARVIRDGFGLVGLDDAWSRPYGGPGPNLGLATASLPREMPRVLLAHQPNGFSGNAGRVALQLSGHTHGGQIRPANYLLRGPVAGRYERRGSTLYVNRGFGVAGPPARIGVRPEITKIVLVSA